MFPFQPGDKLNASDLNVAIKQSYQNFTAQEDIGAKVPVIINSSGYIQKGTIDQIENFIGFTMDAVSSGAITPSGVQTSGIVDGLSGLTIGSYYTLGDVAGELVAGAREGSIGLAVDVDKLLIIQANNENTICGDGSDGDVTISADTTLTRDMYYNNLTIDAGATLYTAGYRVWIKGKLSGGGVIDNSGGDGSAGENSDGTVIGAGGAGGSGTPTGTLTGSPSGGAGGDGGDGDTAAPGGTAGTSESPSIGVAGSGGGNGGNADNGNQTNIVSGGAGGAGGSVTNETFNSREEQKTLSISDSGIERNFITVLFFYGATSGKPLSPSAGSGGGGGGAGGADGGGTTQNGPGGGGAGGAGGNIVIVAKTISETLTIRAKGGNGEKGGDTSDYYSGAGGGGAGGAGGNILLFYNDISTFTGTLDVSGGTGGAGGANTNDTDSTYKQGSPGADGNPGHIFKIKL